MEKRRDPPMSCTSSCHCGALNATVEEELTKGMTCNCSICRRKGNVHFTTRDKATFAARRNR
jgi:hypothetical protein